LNFSDSCANAKSQRQLRKPRSLRLPQTLGIRPDPVAPTVLLEPQPARV
jgi:hypothetical protein